ncbi:hypothetical protein B0H17DRAFT_954597, partial [Mycena rosella]
QTFTVNVDLTCATNLGFLLMFIDYYIKVITNNNRHKAHSFLACHTFNRVIHSSFFSPFFPGSRVWLSYWPGLFPFSTQRYKTGWKGKEN